MVKKIRGKRIEINFFNKLFYAFIVIGVSLAIGAGVYAAVDPAVPYHSAGQVNVTVDGGSTYTSLQEAITAGSIGGSGMWTGDANSINYGGNVGVGTVSPFYKLDVAGNVRSTVADGFRISHGGESVIHRYDGSNYYLLFSDTETGGWNMKRPFSMNYATGNVNIGKNTLYVEHSGNVGIGITNPDPRYKLQVVGAIGADSFEYTSDESLKENVEVITSALDKVMALEGVSFEWIDDETNDKNLGFIAQDVEGVLPEVVSTGENGLKAVEYGNIVAVLVEAIKEQQKEIDELKLMLDN